MIIGIRDQECYGTYMYLLAICYLISSDIMELKQNKFGGEWIYIDNGLSFSKRENENVNLSPYQHSEM